MSRAGGVQTCKESGDFGDIGYFCLRQVSLSAEIAEKVQAALESLQNPNAEIISNEVPIIFACHSSRTHCLVISVLNPSDANCREMSG